MKATALATLCFATVLTLNAADAKKEFVPHPVTATLYVTGVQCSSCSESITAALKRVKSVTDVQIEPNTGYANISFDTHVSSYHQIAQAVADASPQHGDAYKATLKARVPDYAKGDNGAAVDKVFAKSKEQVQVEFTDKPKGEITISFLPLKVDKSKEGPQGWNAGKFGHPIHDPAPKGLGLAFQIVKEGQAAAPKAAKKK
jgi:copper chaperone CopZ